MYNSLTTIQHSKPTLKASISQLSQLFQHIVKDSCKIEVDDGSKKAEKQFRLAILLKTKTLVTKQHRLEKVTIKPKLNEHLSKTKTHKT